MKYKDLKEVDKNTWDGEPFYAIVIDDDEEEVYESDLEELKDPKYPNPNKIENYYDGRWEDIDGISWEHVYRIEDNLIKKEN